MKTSHLLAAAGLLLSSSVAIAEWKGVGELGVVVIEGNSESQTMNSSVAFDYLKDKWEHGTKLAGTSSSNDGERSAESYQFDWNSKYSLSEKTFLFGDVRYLDDKFDSFEGIANVSIGAGYRIYLSEKTTWNISVGAGYRETELLATEEDPAEKQSGASFLLINKFSRQLTETTTLTNNTRIDSAEDNTAVQNVFGLNVAISSVLALKLGYEVRFNSEPADGDEDTDTISSVNLVYNF